MGSSNLAEIGTKFSVNSRFKMILYKTRLISVYTSEREHDKLIVVIWVDEGIIASSDELVLKNVKNMFTTRLKMKDLGKL